MSPENTHDPKTPLNQVTTIITPQFAELGVASSIGEPKLRVGQTKFSARTLSNEVVLWAEVSVNFDDGETSADAHRQLIADIAIALRDAGHKVVVTEEVVTTL